VGVNLATGYQLNEWLQPEVELNYVHSGGGATVEATSITAGFVICPWHNATLLLGVQRTVAGVNTDAVTRGTVGLQVKF
jgi:hypothetical protein